MSGEFRVVGGLANHTLYVNDQPDGNGNNWIFYFDDNLQVWKFWYGGIPQPGDDVLGQIVSEYDSTLTGQYFSIGNENKKYSKDSTLATMAGSLNWIIASTTSIVI